MIRRTFTVALCLSATLALTATSPDARACGGAWYPVMDEPEPDVDHRPYGVPIAEKSLDEGNTVAAAGRIIRMIPHVRNLSPRSASIVERAQRVLALAVVRHDGALPVGRELPDHVEGRWLGKTDEDRTANLAWAVDILRTVSGVHDDDPQRQTELAEALARTDRGASEARRILERLAARDLVTSPEGYAALAKLRARAGDREGQSVALARCAAMAPSPAACRERSS